MAPDDKVKVLEAVEATVDVGEVPELHRDWKPVSALG